MAEAEVILQPVNPLRTIERIRDRTVEAVLGQSGLNHPALTAEIRRRFGGIDVAAGALVREPLIEGAAPFVPGDRTFAECAGTLLHPKVIEAISRADAEPYRFPPEARPYAHQIAAWEHLTASERRSVLVSSGTGSGKTECFLMPLLHDLATEAETTGRLSGVRAIMLYPLNALIASQQERLSAWTKPFGDHVRFGLYNGLTPEKLREADKTKREQAEDRATLRTDPPPILVTNVTMLEYMSVRRIDRPLIDNSHGTLRWIILDEAHSYVGSAAAEVALLIRRVLLTFGVRPEDVRFVATSATIGEGRDVTDELRRFLRDLSGVDESKVQVVLGERAQVVLPAKASSSVLDMPALADRDRLAASPAVQAFIRSAEAGAIQIASVEAMLAPTGQQAQAVIAAIAATDTQHPDPLLPLRVHGFLRAVPGLWSCLNPACPDAPKGWAFGTILSERIERCPHADCRSPVLEVMLCRECGEPYLDGNEEGGRLRLRVTPPTVDEFAALAEREIAEREEDEEEEDPASRSDGLPAIRRAFASRLLPGGRPLHVVVTSGETRDSSGDETMPLAAHDPGHCGACNAASGKSGDTLRPLRYGAPFLIGNAAPVLLEGMPPAPSLAESRFARPAGARQLLSFTDSRQGTARFAANLQTNAERGFVRGFLYHTVQGSMVASGADSPKVAELAAEIATLEGANVPALAEMIAGKKDALANLQLPSTIGISWTQMRDRLAITPEVAHWMAKVWGPRDERYRAAPLAFAQFLLLREFARRPRRANTAETMGLARLRYDAIDRARNTPAPVAEKGYGQADWQGLLYTMIDMIVRANFAIRALPNDTHWLHAQTSPSQLLEPGQAPQGTREMRWPIVGTRKGLPSNIVLILEKRLGLDRTEPRDRAALNTVLEAAWAALLPIFSSPDQSDYRLDFAKARIAPVLEAWRCPVTGRVLPATALGLSPYGHRDGLATADLLATAINFPPLPVAFPRNEDDRTIIRGWLKDDPQIAALRGVSTWADLHDRVALLSPYLRSAEHSAQQPPARLRDFERDFKKGEINILNCSTTMEMGVDIGSVSGVIMTNVPPALANYRQRIGRAGRRGQGFATSLTYTRDTPIDREAFYDPLAYLCRQTRAPQVKLDSRRIVQRHINALLLARWFASDGGEALKTRAGDFFGLPEILGADRLSDAPVVRCLTWIGAPSTQTALARQVAMLVTGTILAGDTQLFAAAEEAIKRAHERITAEWEVLQAQAATVPPEAKAGMGHQLKRLTQEGLLKELAVRDVLPGHGFPTAVVQFVTGDKPDRDDGQSEETRQRRRSYPSRNLDIAIRDYAPGAEVVVDGLVHRSAGVTLNWRRPADDAEAREIQSIKTFWSCPSCGAADCAHAVPEVCPQCHAEVPLKSQRRFLEPGGFTVDTRAAAHADTEQVSYIEPEPEQIVARGAAWAACADPAQGRLRASSDGLVFYSSRGAMRAGYHVCLDCGRAEPAGTGNADRPLLDHAPLRHTRADAAGRCPGNDKSFKILREIALGHETVTDVAELQPVGLETESSAWAAIAALRGALARRLGIEVGELGMAVRAAPTAVGQRTHSLFLFDRASGGAGFAPQGVALYETLIADAARILDCREPGCVRGCSACIMTADLHRQHETVDRRPALAWAKAAAAALATVADEDRAGLDPQLCRSVADELAAQVDRGARTVTIWIGGDSDVAALAQGTSFARLARRLTDRGAAIALVIDPVWLDALDAAARLALRDMGMGLGLSLHRDERPHLDNGAGLVAATAGAMARSWASRDPAAALPGDGWGQAHACPVVSIEGAPRPLPPAIRPDDLLPAADTRFIEVSDQLDGTIADFGADFARLLLPAIRAAGGTGRLTTIAYSDRYLQSPLVVRLMAEALAGLRDALGGDAATIQVTTNPFKPNDRQPFAPDHDWQWPEDRREVLLALLATKGLAPALDERGAAHGRVISLSFDSGVLVRIILDQGFGVWRTLRGARFNHFSDDTEQQARKINAYSAMVTARGTGYIVVTR